MNPPTPPPQRYECTFPDGTADHISTALYNGELTTLKNLLKTSNKKLDFRSHFGDNLLHMASSYGKSIEMIEFLFAEGRKVNKLGLDDGDAYGRTALMVAAANNHIPVCKWFIAKGANVDVRVNDRGNILHRSGIRGLTDVLKFFFTLGKPRLDVRNIGKLTPEGLAEMECVELLKARAAQLADPEYKQIFVQEVMECVANPMKFCSMCDAEERDGKILKVCPCRRKKYCDSTCQKKCRKQHSAECKRWCEEISSLKLASSVAVVAIKEDLKAEEIDTDNFCSFCHNNDKTVEKLICAACDQTQYCSTTCQAAGWAEPKADCTMWGERSGRLRGQRRRRRRRWRRGNLIANRALSAATVMLE